MIQSWTLRESKNKTKEIIMTDSHILILEVIQ